jgi:hypothetical protein
MLKVRLNDKAVGLTELDKTTTTTTIIIIIIIIIQCRCTECCLKIDESKSVNIFSANKVAMLCYVMLCYVMLCYIMYTCYIVC